MSNRTIPLEILDAAEASVATTRRDFCRAACQAALVAAGLGQVACGGGDSPTGPSGGGGGGGSAPPLASVNANIVNGVVTLNVDGTPLASAGGAALVQSSAGSFLVVRTDATTVSALTAQCTHQQCTISGYASPNFVCPCHGSRFDASGAVVNGPATQALRRFSATLANGVLTIA